MKKGMNNPVGERESTKMVSEYDCMGKKGVCGRYYRAYREGQAVWIRHDEGGVSVQYFTLEDRGVMLRYDVREYFSPSESNPQNRRVRE
jgi:hypothetical protein